VGLDMFLRGKKYHMDRRRKIEGFELESETFELGYWRKHPNLHGYIVEKFADGQDNCQSIYLETKNLERILGAVMQDGLPHTTGFFFGESESADYQDTAKQIEGAIKWLNVKDNDVLRSVYYWASW
tara:strand:+ start:1075 stop:1452 length:378 start_codon:yes stop_codon:yes gene_type:complete